MADIKQLAERLELAPDLGPQNREFNYKGRIRQVFKTFSSNMGGLMGVNILTLLFCAPFVALFLIYMPIDEAGRIAGQALNFSGGLGIGYGVVDQTNVGIQLIYDLRIKYFLFYFVPCMLVASIGFAGAFHCCRNYLRNTKTKVLKHFFRGIAKHWWKFLLMFGFLSIFVAGFMVGMFQLLKANALNTLSVGGQVGYWFLVIICGIAFLLGVAYSMLSLPTSVQYNFSLKANIKNTCLLLPQVVLPTLFIIIALAAPTLLIMSSFFKYLIYMFFAMMGISLYSLFTLAYGQYVNDNFVRVIYDFNEKQKIKDQEKANRKVNAKVNNTKKNNHKPRKKK